MLLLTLALTNHFRVFLLNSESCPKQLFCLPKNQTIFFCILSLHVLFLYIFGLNTMSKMYIVYFLNIYPILLSDGLGWRGEKSIGFPRYNFYLAMLAKTETTKRNNSKNITERPIKKTQRGGVTIR